ncbi:MAG: dehydrogenase [Saprospiraceae bacterium]|nr:dehydrogenase [Saprospiraceae bacterium]
MVRSIEIPVLLVIFLVLWSCGSPKYVEPLSSVESLQSLQVDENFEVSLFASEPWVQDPVEMVFDEKGNIYVVEMPDYPFQPEGPDGEGRIKVLFDRNRDGQIDDAVVFADGIKDATSVQPWQGGILVTAAPYIYYMKDNDGDFIADEREVLFSGFFQENQEAQITNLRFNVDNWIYAANQGRSADVLFSEDSSAIPLKLRGADFRFRLDKGLFEPETAAAQFGQALNDWGHRFITQNTLHIQQMVVPWRYLHRHTHLPSTKGVTNISDHDLLMYQKTEAPYWRVERSNRRQKRYDEENLDRIEHIDSHFTGASGGTHYGGDLFPQAYQGNVFTGEVMGNLVHRDVITLSSDEVSYVAQRGEQDQHSEFLVSSDPWFRPAHFTVGPDGALYVVDMYRQHIETPLSIPEDLKEEMDFMRGSDQGRVYRIVPKGTSTKLPLDVLQATNSPAQYVEWLTHPNQWYRLHGQRLLLELQNTSVLPQVQGLFDDHLDPRTRLHALYVLEGMDALSPRLIKNALADKHPRIREHGLILAESCVECFDQVAGLAEDPDTRVVMQTALSLGAFPKYKSLTVMGKILEKYYEDHWMRLAVLSSEVGSSMAFFEQLKSMAFFDQMQDGKGRFIEDFAHVVGSSASQNEVVALLQSLQQVPATYAMIGCQGLSSGLKKSAYDIASSVYDRIAVLGKNDKEEIAKTVEFLLDYFSTDRHNI